jgi:UDP-2,4-diacetamido-2,4,6-trideoxy-beta-L-altropyranose hydrolase
MSDTCLIRCEYSETIGLGHLMRCLALARELNNYGYTACVLSADGQPKVRSKDIEFIDQWYTTDQVLGSLEDASNLVLLAENIGASLIVLDFYNINEDYQLILREAELHWMQFDGLANHPFWADWVVSMSPAASIDKYSPLRRKAGTHFLLGPEYAILRPEFIACRDKEKKIDDVNQLLLTFGGGDDFGMIQYCLDAINKLDWCGDIYVVVGQANPNIDKIVSWISLFGKDRVRLSVDEPDMAKVMSEADMAIISGGMTTFEAAVIGVPTLMLHFADNQQVNVEAWEQFGVTINLGSSNELTEKLFCQQFMDLIKDRCKRKAMSQRSMEIVDGLGVKNLVKQLLGTMGTNA